MRADAADLFRDNQVDYVDYGTALVMPVGGLARVDIYGNEANLAFWAWRVTRIEHRIERKREVVLNMVAGRDAVGSMVEMIIDAFGPRLILQQPAFAMNRLPA
ncbi:MAG: hypothetical protein GEU95_01070 [Rhizobiales bacterium]|nr:hypothetical protein [Hyphomicrobiales bacterium]